LAAASVSAAALPIDERSLREALGFVAFWIQARSHVGTWTDEEIRPELERFLCDEDIGLAFDRSAARTGVDTVLGAAERVGVLVRGSTTEYGFFHRSMQEYLCATHVARLSLDEQRSLVGTRCSDARWREVILALLWLTTRPADVRRFVEDIRQRANDLTDASLVARELLAEIVFGDYRCPAALAREVADVAFLDVEEHPWTPHRRRTATHIVQGLRSPALQGVVREHLKRWLFARPFAVQYGFRGVETWLADDTTASVCSRGLESDDVATRRAAGIALAKSGANTIKARDLLWRRATASMSPGTRAAATHRAAGG
jgi:hypothetical protein